MNKAHRQALVGQGRAAVSVVAGTARASLRGTTTSGGSAAAWVRNGRLDLDLESMEPAGEPGYQLNVDTAAADTPAADALKLLASWAASQERLSTESVAAWK